MLWTLIKNDLRYNRLQTFNIAFFILLSSVFLATAGQLGLHLADSVSHLFEKAKTPHIMQMHTGEIDRYRMQAFVNSQKAISDYQILNFLNINNVDLAVNGQPMTDSVYDNGFSVQSPHFDYLLDLKGSLIQAKKGEVYVPVLYLTNGLIKLNDTLTVKGYSLKVAGFVRDSQMNSSLSTSRRFIVNQADYEAIAPMGTLEYLIEFRLNDLSQSSQVEAAYNKAGLEADGPPLITYALFQLMNAFSDGIIISALVLIAFLVTAISLLCIRLMLLAKLEEDYQELAVLKAIGFPMTRIRWLFLSKYCFIAGLASVTGFFLSFWCKQPLLDNMKLIFGESKDTIWVYMIAFGLSGLIFFLIYISMLRLAGQLETLSLNPKMIQETVLPMQLTSRLPRLLKLFFSDLWARKTVYATMMGVFILSVFVLVLPLSVYTTISDNSFHQYLGLGNYDVRIDLSQLKGKEKSIENLLDELKRDSSIEKMTVYRSQLIDCQTNKGQLQKLWIDFGLQDVFPIKYIDGQVPKNQNEIALSKLKADELQKKTGDKLTLTIDGREKSVTVSGIYSDLTNGGKTAKASFETANQEVIWMTIPLQLKKGFSAKSFVSHYQKRYAFGQFSDLATYSKQIFGSTIDLTKAVTGLAFGASVLLVFLNTLLFVRMLFIKDRDQIALLMATGFTNLDITKLYLLTAESILIIGMFLGYFLVLTLGNRLATVILTAIGLAGVKLIYPFAFTYFVLPLILLTATCLATLIAVRGLKKIEFSRLLN